mmetsp:Transcript_64676/g.179927  ORF Transcript_64676/g.179927 Transcript_64676/m.179927 type:complete len:499 (+) Transcript_64676:32-1528(+)
MLVPPIVGGGGGANAANSARHAAFGLDPRHPDSHLDPTFAAELASALHDSAGAERRAPVQHSRPGFLRRSMTSSSQHAGGMHTFRAVERICVLEGVLSPAVFSELDDDLQAWFIRELKHRADLNLVELQRVKNILKHHSRQTERRSERNLTEPASSARDGIVPICLHPPALGRAQSYFSNDGCMTEPRCDANEFNRARSQCWVGAENVVPNSAPEPLVECVHDPESYLRAKTGITLDVASSVGCYDDDETQISFPICKLLRRVMRHSPSDFLIPPDHQTKWFVAALDMTSPSRVKEHLLVHCDRYIVAAALLLGVFVGVHQVFGEIRGQFDYFIKTFIGLGYVLSGMFLTSHLVLSTVSQLVSDVNIPLFIKANQMFITFCSYSLVSTFYVLWVTLVALIARDEMNRAITWTPPWWIRYVPCVSTAVFWHLSIVALLLNIVVVTRSTSGGGLFSDGCPVLSPRELAFMTPRMARNFLIRRCLERPGKRLISPLGMTLT